MKKEMAMLPQFAAFNCHINGAKAKAKKRFLGKFSRENWYVEIQPLIDAGIMTIFHKPPNPFTQFYVDQITDIVNEGRVKEGQS